MSEELGPLEVDCDSPSYSIVRACQRLGMESPEDVRWCRLSKMSEKLSDWGQAFLHPWKLFSATEPQAIKACRCGEVFPLLERCTFTLLSGREESYLIGQCKKCHTIFWEDMRTSRPLTP
jgi:hypothetical protein